MNVQLVVSAGMACSTPPRWTEPEPVAGLDRGFTTVRFDDYGKSQETIRAYATLVVPRRAGEAVLPLERPEISGSPDGWHIRVRVADRLYTGEWRLDRLAICHGDKTLRK